MMDEPLHSERKTYHVVGSVGVIIFGGEFIHIFRFEVVSELLKSGCSHVGVVQDIAHAQTDYKKEIFDFP
jgi:hypothetical protein